MGTKCYNKCMSFFSLNGAVGPKKVTVKEIESWPLLIFKGTCIKLSTKRLRASKICSYGKCLECWSLV